MNETRIPRSGAKTKCSNIVINSALCRSAILSCWAKDMLQVNAFAQCTVPPWFAREMNQLWRLWSVQNDIIELFSLPKSFLQACHERIFILSCPDDDTVYLPLKKEGLRVHNAELVLTGVLKQEINSDLYRL